MYKTITNLGGAIAGATYFMGVLSAVTYDKNTDITRGSYEGYQTSIQELSSGKIVVHILKPKNGMVKATDRNRDGVFEDIEVLGVPPGDDLLRFANFDSLEKIAHSLKKK